MKITTSFYWDWTDFGVGIRLFKAAGGMWFCFELYLLWFEFDITLRKK